MTVIAQTEGQDWAAYNADCVMFAENLPDNSIDFSVYSPPFSSLYVYSESVADMGNVENDDQFIEQYRYLLKQIHRVTRPGRLTAIHVKDLVYYQNSSERGTSGIRPFSDMCTKAHMDVGFDFHTRVTIYRDPVMEMYKTKAHGLLWKTFREDGSFSRVGMPEYLMVYRKWAKEGEEDLIKPVSHPREIVPLDNWQDLATPVWKATNDFHCGSPVWNFNQPGKGDKDMPATDVLNVYVARDEKAEKHLCPMPLNITERSLMLWSNEGDTVFSPFMGIGSEGVACLRNKRKFIGTEINPTYYNQAVKNLGDENLTKTTAQLFD